MGFRKRNEAEIAIELVGPFVFSIDDDRRGCDLSTHNERSFQGIDQEQLPYALPFAGEITGKPSEERSSYSFVSRQIQLPDQFLRKIFGCNIVLCERVESRQRSVIGSEHIDNAGSPLNVLTCLLFQVPVQFQRTA